MKHPGAFLLAALFLPFFRFFFRHDPYLLVESFTRQFKAFNLFFCQNVFRVLQPAGSSYNVIAGHRDADFVITKRKGKLTGPEVLFVLPAFDIIKHTHAREPLRNKIDVVAIFREKFTTGAPTDLHHVVDVVAPIYLEREFFTRLERLRQIHPHHGEVDDMVERFITGIAHRGNLVTPFEVIGAGGSSQKFGRNGIPNRSSGGFPCHAAIGQNVLIQLQPQIGKWLRRIIVVGYSLGTT